MNTSSSSSEVSEMSNDVVNVEEDVKYHSFDSLYPKPMTKRERVAKSRAYREWANGLNNRVNLSLPRVLICCKLCHGEIVAPKMPNGSKFKGQVCPLCRGSFDL